MVYVGVMDWFLIIISGREMEESQTAKIENIEEMECEACSKTFPNEGMLKTHMKTKHSAEELSKEKSDPMKYAPKSTSKGGFEQYQQDLEDKIFAFLGELGEKNVVTNDDVGEVRVEVCRTRSRTR